MRGVQLLALWAMGAVILGCGVHGLKFGGNDVEADKFHHHAPTDTSSSKPRWEHARVYGQRHRSQDRSLFPGPEIVAAQNITLKVVTSTIPPFVMKNETEGYYGFCIDLLDLIALRFGFRYEIYEPADGSFGVMLGSQYNGVIGELTHGDADVSFAPLTITKQRETVVDFTEPFLDSGYTIMTKRPVESKSIWSFFDPFDVGLWMSVALSILCMGFVIYLIERLSPFGLHHDEELDTENKGVWSLPHSIWFSFAAFVQAGSDQQPRSLSARVVTMAWYFVILVFIATYTANLAAFLTVSRLESPVASLEDISDSGVEFGTLRDTSTEEYFTSSYSPDMQKMSDDMRLYGDVEDAKEDLRTGALGAFIFDAAIIDFETNRKPCDLVSVGRLFGRFGYGVALRQGSPYVEMFTGVILELREKGAIDELYLKWFAGENSGCSSGGHLEAGAVETSTDTATLTLEDTAGVFYLLLGVVGISVLVLACEHCASHHSDRKTRASKETMKDQTGPLLELQTVTVEPQPSSGVGRDGQGANNALRGQLDGLLVERNEWTTKYRDCEEEKKALERKLNNLTSKLNDKELELSTRLLRIEEERDRLRAEKVKLQEKLDAVDASVSRAASSRELLASAMGRNSTNGSEGEANELSDDYDVYGAFEGMVKALKGELLVDTTGVEHMRRARRAANLTGGRVERTLELALNDIKSCVEETAGEQALEVKWALTKQQLIALTSSPTNCGNLRRAFYDIVVSFDTLWVSGGVDSLPVDVVTTLVNNADQILRIAVLLRAYTGKEVKSPRNLLSPRSKASDRHRNLDSSVNSNQHDDKGSE